MKSKIPIPRSPRNLKPNAVSKKIQWLVWLARVSWALAGVLLTTLVGFVSQGPDSVRRIPEIPAAVFETASKTWDEFRIDRELSRTWEYLPANDAQASKTKPIRIALESKNGSLLGELYSPAVRTWTIYEMALVDGRRDGAVLHLTVFDFVLGKRKDFAKIDVAYQEQPTDGITDHAPALVLGELSAKTTWQIGAALPTNFSLRKVAD
jgi:hypothetical protein